ncbi:branched-chain amino acid ABC transporter permease [Zavarzinia compransoris]|uniref:Branched-chain amino acid ABC transporter permease n=1 Tax=Zavarzinia compransoris TaxID=1264899 RepID=A0A317E612_9PROT|nr:branched-chain amino acid ABC transporter permease [Zavarzinia compransoris]PWR21650.1 branched-chain amino acid ABC transporter permease [Zavarzinia compransoris]TDP45569.1 amino acid/amide ABC transporter membrane protein 2 (HAAT family) [Zavarzinia compransoris]
MNDFIIAYEPLLTLMAINCLLAFSQYVVLRAGVFSKATAGLAGLGAYAAAITNVTFGWPAPLSFLFAIVVGGVLAFLISVPLQRLRGVFQAIATLAFVQIVVAVLLLTESLTGGAFGFNNIPKLVNVWHVLLVTAGAFYILYALNRSSVGRAFDTIRQDETVALALGMSVSFYIGLAFVLSGIFAGAAGGLIAFYTRALMPEQFGFPLLVSALAFVVLGGRISIYGPIVGSAVLTLLPEIARPVADQKLVLYGSILVVAMIYMPDGIVDTLRNRRNSQIRAAKSAAAKTAPAAEARETQS